MIRILGTIFAGLLGLAFGSFLNVCLSRWPAGESIVRPRSHCCHCNRTLAWWENVPLLSWLTLRGRCRTCRAWIGWRYPLVELAVGALWAVQVEQGLNDFNAALFLDSLPSSIDVPPAVLATLALMLVSHLLLLWLMVALACLDIEHLWLPDLLTIGGTGAGLLLSTSIFSLQDYLDMEDFSTHHLFDRLLLAFLGQRLIAIVVAAGLILLIRWLYWLVRHREGMGLGDAKLMAMLAAWLGLPGALLSFGLGVMLGALTAIVMLIVPSTRRESGSLALHKLPLGTFLCFGGIVSSLWGQQILAVYLHWAGF
jgi:leader peptidase (prepilin peptidase)/N-methyltransferase